MSKEGSARSVFSTHDGVVGIPQKVMVSALWPGRGIVGVCKHGIRNVTHACDAVIDVVVVTHWGLTVWIEAWIADILKVELVGWLKWLKIGLKHEMVDWLIDLLFGWGNWRIVSMNRWTIGLKDWIIGWWRIYYDWRNSLLRCLASMIGWFEWLISWWSKLIVWLDNGMVDWWIWW